jgi:aspartyl-tRNA synthetase
METNKIPTAEEFLKEESGRWPRSQEVISSIMRDFAKLHVKAALEAAFVKIKEDAMETYGSDVPDCWSDSSILNAYPENLIK